MRDTSAEIIDEIMEVCKAVHPDFDTHGSISAIYKRSHFEKLFDTIGALYLTLVCFNIPTKYLNIDVGDTSVRITLDYRGLKILCSVYGEAEEGEE